MGDFFDIQYILVYLYIYSTNYGSRMIEEKRGPRPPQQYWKLDVWEDDARRRKR